MPGEIVGLFVARDYFLQIDHKRSEDLTKQRKSFSKGVFYESI